MKIIFRSLITLILSVQFFPSFALAETERLLAMTLLPNNVSSENAPEDINKGFLWVQKKPSKEVGLQFNLNRLPAGLSLANFKNITLRLVAKKVIYTSGNNTNSGGDRVTIRARSVKNNFKDGESIASIFSLNTLTEENEIAFQRTANNLPREAFFKAYSSGEKLFSIMLNSGSDKASTLLYSPNAYGETPSNKPHLVVEYSLGSPGLMETFSWSQHQQNPEHTGRSQWIPFRNPNGVTLKELDLSKITRVAGTIADYPLIYKGKLYVVYKIGGGENYFEVMNFKGKRYWWETGIGKGVVQRSPVISRNGIMYIVTEGSISAHDLNNKGISVGKYNLPGNLSAYTDLTIGNDGSLFLALKEKDMNYVYGFDPKLQPFMKAGPFGSGEEKISTLTVSPDGTKLFAQSPEGGKVIDIANPSDVKTLALNNKNGRDYFHVPVVAPDGNTVMFSAYAISANNGGVWGRTEDRKVWDSSGTTTPQPVLGSNDNVYFIQDGQLQRHKFDELGSNLDPKGSGLRVSSNLVMDGANNLFFWDNGTLLGFDREGNSLFKVNVQGLKISETEGPEQFIRLMMGPDGTLWANNKNGSSLYAFEPTYKEANLNLKQADIKNQTVYRAAGEISAGQLVLDNVNIMLQAKNGIKFSKGFKVKKGASLLCRTGN